jgi:hypothetical protein
MVPGGIMSELGKCPCKDCGEIIYAWLDECSECGAAQEKEHLTIVQRLERAGASVELPALAVTIEEECRARQSEGLIDILHALGISTMGDLLNRSMVEIQELVDDEDVFLAVKTLLPCPDTNPLTDEERERKARLLGIAGN